MIDNGAEPEPADPATRFPWIDYVRNNTDVHFRKGCNQGAHRATRSYLFFLNPDAYLTDGEAIALLAAVLDEDATVGMVGPMVRGDDGQLAPQGERQAGLGYLFAQKSYLNALWPGNPIRRRQSRAGASREQSGRVDTVTAAALLCRREQFLGVGGFNEGALAYWEEQELAWKYRPLGLGAYYRADAFVYHHWRKGGSLLDPPALTSRWFEESMRLYYRQAYGSVGAFAYDVLTAFQRFASRVAGRRRAAPESAKNSSNVEST